MFWQLTLPTNLFSGWHPWGKNKPRQTLLFHFTPPHYTAPPTIANFVRDANLTQVSQSIEWSITRFFGEWRGSGEERLCRVGIRLSTVGSHYHLQTELTGKSVQKNISKRKTSLQCTKRSRGKGVSLNTDRLQFLEAWLGFIFLTLDIDKIVYYLFKINLFYLK